MQDAEDRAILRQVVRVVAAAIFCLLCGGISGIFVVRQDNPAAGQGPAQLPPFSSPAG